MENLTKEEITFLLGLLADTRGWSTLDVAELAIAVRNKLKAEVVLRETKEELADK